MTYGLLYGVPVVYAAGNGTDAHSVDVRSTLENLVNAVTGSNSLPARHHVEELVAEMAWRAGLSPIAVAAYNGRIHATLKQIEWEHTGGPWGIG